jgi:hypothetical protein
MEYAEELVDNQPGEKLCLGCNVVKPLTEFYTHPLTADGRQGKCKECQRKAVRENRAAKRKQYSEYERKRRQRPERKAYQQAATKRYRKAHPLEARAHRMVAYHMRRGNLVPEPCEVCGSIEVQAHHDDYAKPLNVRWLCFKHHRELHGQDACGGTTATTTADPSDGSP